MAQKSSDVGCVVLAGALLALYVTVNIGWPAVIGFFEYMWAYLPH